LLDPQVQLRLSSRSCSNQRFYIAVVVQTLDSGGGPSGGGSSGGGSSGGGAGGGSGAGAAPPRPQRSSGCSWSSSAQKHLGRFAAAAAARTRVPPKPKAMLAQGPQGRLPRNAQTTTSPGARPRAPGPTPRLGAPGCCFLFAVFGARSPGPSRWACQLQATATGPAGGPASCKPLQPATRSPQPFSQLASTIQVSAALATGDVGCAL
jgi:hypothetical protein